MSLLSDQSRDETESPFSSSGTQPGGKNLAVYQSILPLLSYWCSLYLGKRLPPGVEKGVGGVHWTDEEVGGVFQMDLKWVERKDLNTTTFLTGIN